MVRTLQGRTPNTMILLELKLKVRTKKIFRAMWIFLTLFKRLKF